jgi:chitodextrinase
MSVRSFLRVAVAAALVLAAAAQAGAAAPRRDRTPPSAPTNLRVTAVSETSVSLAWNPSTDNVGVTTYSLWGEGLSGVQSATHPQTSATWSPLRPGQTVTFRITAFDAQYNASAPSNAVTVTTTADVTAPSAPSGLSVQSVSGSKVELRWTSGVDDFGPVTHEVLVNGVPTGDSVSTVAPGTFPRPAVQGAWVRQLDPATGYRFSVRAIDGAGNVSPASSEVSATTDPSSDTVAPTTPTLLSAFDGGPGQCPEEIWLRWTASTDDVEPASGIEYEVRINGRINEVDTGFTGTVTYTEVHGPNTITIVAVDRAGNASAPSNAITVNNAVTC